ncbi:MAG: hypothetical protein AB7K24_32420 [Gemmataceae bacterium]
MPGCRWLLPVCVVTIFAGTAHGQEHDKEPAWLPKYVAEATILSITGSDFSYVSAAKGDDLRGFDTQGHKAHFFRPNLPDTKVAATISAAPFKLQRVIRHPQTGKITGIELQAESIEKVRRIGQPGSSGRLGELVELRRVTQVSIIPQGNPSKGRMWIIHSDDSHGGVLYAIQLQCTLRPEFFPAQE